MRRLCSPNVYTPTEQAGEEGDKKLVMTRPLSVLSEDDDGALTPSTKCELMGGKKKEKNGRADREQ